MLQKIKWALAQQEVTARPNMRETLTETAFLAYIVGMWAIAFSSLTFGLPALFAGVCAATFIETMMRQKSPEQKGLMPLQDYNADNDVKKAIKNCTDSLLSRYKPGATIKVYVDTEGKNLEPSSENAAVSKYKKENFLLLSPAIVAAASKRNGDLSDVIAHEMGHCFSNHVTHSRLFLTAWIGLVPLAYAVFSSEVIVNQTLFPLLVFSHPLTFFMRRFYARSHEYAADRIGACLTGNPQGIIDFLKQADSPMIVVEDKTKTGQVKGRWQPLLNGLDAKLESVMANHPRFVAAMDSFMEFMMSNHPATKRRIQKLHKLDRLLHPTV